MGISNSCLFIRHVCRYSLKTAQHARYEEPINWGYNDAV